MSDLFGDPEPSPPQLSGFKPLLAAKFEDPTDVERVSLPAIVSPKIDGIRCLLHPTLGPISRKLKAIPNRYVRQLLSRAPPFLDGELVTLSGEKFDDFNTVQSKVMSHEGEPRFVFMVFDSFQSPKSPYRERLDDAHSRVIGARLDWIRLHKCEKVSSLVELRQREEEYVAAGWEGLMIRSLTGRYKFGRATLLEGILTKMKRFDDSEGVVVDTLELMHNGNEAVVNELGNKKRSSHKANLVPMDTLGALSVLWRGVTFEIGTGFDAETRADLWARREEVKGRVVTFKYQGVEREKPRFPVFLGFRHDLESGEVAEKLAARTRARGAGSGVIPGAAKTARALRPASGAPTRATGEAGYAGSVPRNALLWEVNVGAVRVRLRPSLVWADTKNSDERVFSTVRLAKDHTRGAVDG